MRVVEVGPRDGLQNEPTAALSTADRVRLVDALSDCGLTAIEVGSFVSARWVPAMADSAAVFRAIRRRSGVSYAALTPNVRGLESAMEAEASEVAVFASASESFSQANINCSVQDSLRRFEPLLVKAKQSGLPVRGYVSCVIGWSHGTHRHATKCCAVCAHVECTITVPTQCMDHLQLPLQCCSVLHHSPYEVR